VVECRSRKGGANMLLLSGFKLIDNLQHRFPVMSGHLQGGRGAGNFD
jgi:hypothetical protein